MAVRASLEVMPLSIASADRALGALLDGPPRALRVLLQTSAAAYLGSTTDDGEVSRGAQPHLVLVDSGGITVPDSILLPPGLTWRRLLAPHGANRTAPVLIGNGYLRCGHRTIAVRPHLDLTAPAVPVHRAAAGLAQIEAALRNTHQAGRHGAHQATRPAGPQSAHQLRTASPWPALHHRWSSGVADPATLVADAPRLIGRGPGVTPSGDDIVAAAILGHTVLGTPGIGAAAARITELSIGRTTAAALVSTRGAADGRAVEPLRRALSALAQGRDAAVPLRHALSLGHTSGADLLRGLRDAFAAVAQSTCIPPAHGASTHAASTDAASGHSASTLATSTHPAPHGVAERKVS